MRSKSDFGIIGLGVMGSNLSLNFLDNNVALSVYNRSTQQEQHLLEDFLKSTKKNHQVQGFTNLKEFVESIQPPRKLLIMIKSGPAIDNVIEELKPFLDQGDIIIDGGNSFYKNTSTRQKNLLEEDIHFIGCGISGGAEGARFGPSLMPSGDNKAYESIAPLLDIVSAKDKNGKPCCTYIGKGSCGHYVKMIHNGIEYAEIQLLAELYAILKCYYSNQEMAEIFQEWNQGELNSYLLEISVDILQTKENDQYLVDLILDKSGNKGTGFWAVRSGLELGVTTSMMSSALYARYLSSHKNLRTKLSTQTNKRTKVDAKPDLIKLKNAYQFARLINHHQGFSVLMEASTYYEWDLDLFEIARIWTNGCIIRSSLMEELAENKSLNNSILESEIYFNKLNNQEQDVIYLLESGLKNRISIECFYSAYNYWISMTTEHLPANLIQAQRDFFGGHTFERIDRPEGEFFSHNWKTDA